MKLAALRERCPACYDRAVIHARAILMKSGLEI